MRGQPSGHCGQIDLKAKASQVIYLQSQAVTLPTIFGGRQFLTIYNEGPGEMKVWIDTLPSQSVQLGGGLAGPPVADSLPQTDPQGAGIPPALPLKPGQSATVAVSTVVIVGTGQSPARGCYVISWCCPQGLNLSLTGDPSHPRWFEGVIVASAR